MVRQLSIEDLLKEKEEPVRMPKAQSGEKVYEIPGDVWEGRCQFCVHKVGKENYPVPLWALFKCQFDQVKPCRIMSIARFNERPGECMSFAPRLNVYGICETCVHNNQFREGFCMKPDHAEQHRVYWGGDFGGDARNVDYWGRHRFSVCADYEPDQNVKEGRY